MFQPQKKYLINLKRIISTLKEQGSACKKLHVCLSVAKIKWSNKKFLAIIQREDSLRSSISRTWKSISQIYNFEIMTQKRKYN